MDPKCLCYLIHTVLPDGRVRERGVKETEENGTPNRYTVLRCQRKNEFER